MWPLFCFKTFKTSFASVLLMGLGFLAAAVLEITDGTYLQLVWILNEPGCVFWSEDWGYLYDSGLQMLAP